MIKNFDDAFRALMGDEGGYTVDDGGATRWGITETVARENGYEGDMKDLPIELAKQIAKKKYWDVHSLDQIDPNVAFYVFDAAYNGGAAVIWLQKAAGVKPDNVIGAGTIAAVRGTDPLKIILRFSAYHMQYLTSLSEEWPHAGKGWANRAAANALTVTN